MISKYRASTIKLLSILLLAVLFSTGKAQGIQTFINHVNSLPVPQRQAAVDDFMQFADTSGFPYIHVDTACFIIQGSASSASVAGDFNNWTQGINNMLNISGTDFWYYYRVFELNARLDYKFVINGSNWILDPLNPNIITGGYGPNSELAMPQYVQPWEIEVIPGTPVGALESFSLNSSYTSSTFQVAVYLPYNYDPLRQEAYPTAYFHDGFEYITLGDADKVLNNLIASDILDTIIAVFIQPNNRNEEYAGSLRNQYMQFVVQELIPYIDNNYNTIQSATGRAVCGASFGGNISTLISYNHPDIFGNCGLHSAALWPNNYEAYNLVKNGPVKNIIWASVWGSYDGGKDDLRLFRNDLLNSSYTLSWLELPEGHSWGLWRSTIDELLPFFFPGTALSIADQLNDVLTDLLVYPIPFNTSVSIEYKLEHPVTISLSIYDIVGRLVYSINDQQYTGQQIIVWNPCEVNDGLYFYRLKAGNDLITGKILKGR